MGGGSSSDRDGGPTMAVESRIEPGPAAIDPLHDAVRRHRRRQRALGAALVAALVAGPIVGMAVERSRQPDVAAVTSEGGTTSASRSTAGSSGGTASRTAASEAAMPIEGDRGHRGGVYWGEPLEPLGTGTVGDLQVRLYAMSYEPYDDGNPFWDAPPGCEVIGALSIQVSTPATAAVLSAERFGVPDTPDGTIQLVGVPEGDPRWVAVAEVGADRATVTLPDGQVVDGTGIGGIVVASAPAPGFADVPQGEQGFRATVEAGSRTHEIHSWSYPSEEFHREHCQPPPPTLPEPGEQPADPAAATEQVRSTLTTVFGPDDIDDRAELVQHPEVIVPASAQLAQNYPDLVATATMGDLVFTSPTQAYFLYDLDAGIVRFDDQVGEALLVDGRWIIAAETVCVQLRKGGATCEVPDG